MYLFVVALHVVLCVFLILAIILQPGKSGIGATLGGSGGPSSMFGPRGPAGLLQRTTVVAVLFMGTSLTLALYSNQNAVSDYNVADAIQQLQLEEEAVPKRDVPRDTN